MKQIFFLLLFVPVLAKAQIITKVAGNGFVTDSGYGGYCCDNGPATLAELNEPNDLAIDSHGNIYIADARNNRIRMVNASGIITTIAGNGYSGYNGDGIDATNAQLGYLMGVAVDNRGNLYFSDNHRIRMVNASGIITTFAGNGIYGYSGDGGPATSAEIFDPNGLAVDGSGNVYIADRYNNRIRKVNTLGIITTIAGTGAIGYSGDGGMATNAELRYPTCVDVDGSGNIYIVDANGVIRKVNSSGIIMTIAGTGPATSGQLYYPYDVAVDGSGQIFVSQPNNNCIRKISTSGIISTITGSGYPGYAGDGGLASAAKLNGPAGIAVDGMGNVYIADVGNQLIRRICCESTIVNPISSPESKVNVFPNPTTTELTIASSDKINQISTTNLIGQTLYTHEYNTEKVQIDVANLQTGIYFIKINNTEVTKFVKQ